MSEGRIRELLRDLRAPDEHEAEERSWRVVRAAFEQSDRSPIALNPPRARLALAIVVLALIAVAALSPVGAAVGDWVRDAVKPGHEPARKALVSLPTSGRLLVVSAEGPWVVQQNGASRLLGAYDDASWSPHGLFIVATRRSQLVALEPNGRARWSLARPGPVRRARWSPDGFRIAYLDGPSLRVVVADGTGDRRLVRGAAPTAPVWRPQANHVLAFSDWQGRIRLVQTDSDKPLWRSGRGDIPTELSWSSDGKRLLALGGHELRLFDDRGRLVRALRLPRGLRVESGAFAPSGRRFALVRHSLRSGRSDVVLMSGGTTRPERRLFSGAGRFGDLAWSPNGRWLLIAWRDADQWLFIRSAAVRNVEAVSNISRQFNPGARRQPAFPALGSWCCPK